MACCLDGAKTSSKPVLGYCLLGHKEQTSVKLWSEYKKIKYKNGGHSVLGEMG